MNSQDLIKRLHETSQALEQLASHLSEIETEQSEPTAAEEPADLSTEAETETEAAATNETENEIETSIDEDGSLIIETTFEPINDEPEKSKPKADAPAANQNNNPFAKIISNLLSKPLPNASNMGSFNPLQMLTGLSGGLPGGMGMPNLPGLNGQSLPTTLAELHDNPQLLGMLKNVSNNPQMLNMLSTLTGQDSQTLQQTLQSLQPNAAAQAGQAAQATQNIPMPEINVMPTMTAPAAAMPNINAAANGLPATPYLDSLLAEWHWQPYARAWDF